MRVSFFLLFCVVAIEAVAEKQPFDRYQSIIDRHMFGEPPPDFDPEKMPSEVAKSSRASGKELTQEQARLQSSVHFSVINVAADGTPVVGFSDKTNPKAPVHHYIKVGEESGGWKVLNADMAVKQICKFVSGIWQIHPFREGNTRTTAVFTMKWLQTFGFSVDNNVFKDNSWYFRNALVRANYNNIPKRIFATSEFLELFFRNLLFGEQNKLSNRTMLAGALQSATQEISKSQNGTLDGTLNCNLDELALLRFVKETPDATQIEIAKHIGKSERTVKRMTPALIERGLLERENGKRNGKWVVKCEI